MRGSCKGLVNYIASRYDAVAEIGVGPFPDVARALSECGLSVFATDAKPFSHRGLRVIQDDVTAPRLSVYRGVRLLYGLRPPPELVPFMLSLAGKIDADLIVKPLTGDFVGGTQMSYRNSTFSIWRRPR